jgi:hypothetical protein
MIQGFLLDRIDAETRGASVGGEHHPIALSTAHEAKTTLALVKLAEAWADITLNATVLESVPMAARKTFQFLGTHHGVRRARDEGDGPRHAIGTCTFSWGRTAVGSL